MNPYCNDVFLKQFSKDFESTLTTKTGLLDFYRLKITILYYCEKNPSKNIQYQN